VNLPDALLDELADAIAGRVADRIADLLERDEPQPWRLVTVPNVAAALGRSPRWVHQSIKTRGLDLGTHERAHEGAIVKLGHVPRVLRGRLVDFRAPRRLGLVDPDPGVRRSVREDVKRVDDDRNCSIIVQNVDQSWHLGEA
jgi:hypothetical protein